MRKIIIPLICFTLCLICFSCDNKKGREPESAPALESQDKISKKTEKDIGETKNVKKEKKSPMFTLPSGKEIEKSDIDFSYPMAGDIYAFDGTLNLYESPNRDSVVKETECGKFILLEDCDQKYWYFVITDERKEGWINIFDYAEYFKKNYYSDITEFEDLDEIENTYKSAKFREFHLANDSFQINRIGPVLQIEKDGKMIEFFDPADSRMVNHTIVDILYNRYLVMDEELYEGRFLLLWDFEQDKEVSKMTSFPVLSGDGSMFISAGSLRMGFPLEIKIFQPEENELNLLYDNKIDTIEELNFFGYVKNIEWKNNTEILLFLTSYNDNGGESEIRLVFDKEKEEWRVNFPSEE